MVVVFSGQVWDKPLLGFSLVFFGFARPDCVLTLAPFLLVLT